MNSLSVIKMRTYHIEMSCKETVSRRTGRGENKITEDARNSKMFYSNNCQPKSFCLLASEISWKFNSFEACFRFPVSIISTTLNTALAQAAVIMLNLSKTCFVCAPYSRGKRKKKLTLRMRKF